MLAALKSLFEQPASETKEEQQQRLNMVAAALLIETARADFNYDEAEHAALEKLLCSSLQLSTAQVQQLVNDAQNTVDQATSLYQYTREINDHYSPEQKVQLIQSMWKVAYADGKLGKYEEALIRQVAELTYVPHSDYIRSKITAQNTH